MRRKIVWIVLLVVVAGAGLKLASVSRTAAEPTAASTPLVSVTVAKVERKSLPVLIEAVGRAEAKASVIVKSRLDGQVIEVGFAEGRPVRKGQMLVRLDPAVSGAQLRQAEGIVARDRAVLSRLQSDHDRNESLFQQGFISAAALKQSDADLASAAATLRADRASADGARLQLAYTSIEAPISGVAGAALLTVGGGAKANDTALLVINQIDPINVTFSLPESQLVPLQQALKAGPVPVTASVTGVERPFGGTLDFIDNAVDATTGTITAKAVFANAQGALTPGQFARVAVQVGALDEALVVPDQAVESGVDGAYVFVLNADSTVAMRAVKAGAQSSGGRVITSGLASGETVVLTGQSRLRDKAKVAVVSATASAPAARSP